MDKKALTKNFQAPAKWSMLFSSSKLRFVPIFGRYFYCPASAFGILIINTDPDPGKPFQYGSGSETLLERVL